MFCVLSLVLVCVQQCRYGPVLLQELAGVAKEAAGERGEGNRELEERYRFDLIKGGEVS